MDIRSLIIPFLVGGFIVSAVKYASGFDTKVAAVIGGFPTGLLSIWFLNDKEAYGYGWDYGIITSVLLLSVIVFNVLYKYFKLSKNVSYFLALLTWFTVAFLRVFG